MLQGKTFKKKIHKNSQEDEQLVCLKRNKIAFTTLVDLCDFNILITELRGQFCVLNNKNIKPKKKTITSHLLST